MTFLLLLSVLLATGCSTQSPKSIDTTEVSPEPSTHHTPSSKDLRQKKLSWLKNTKQNFNEHDLIWDRLLSLYALPEVNDPRVERELNWFLDHPDYIARVQQRAEPYLYQILNEIETQNIPGELALLPIVESAFKPEAVSSASAAGLWQFMPATGLDFGLKQNWWYDGRQDICTSTQAAASYLKDLSEAFGGDWLLALASYNYGKGNIRKAIDRNELRGEPTDYWSLRSLPEETMQYVPKLLAIAKLFAHAEEYNIPLHPIRNKPVFEVVDIGSPLYLSQAAAMANTNTERFLKLNPAYKQNATAPDGPHHLLIPVAQVTAFKENLGRIPEEERAQVTQQLRNQQFEMLAARRAVEAEKLARKLEAEKAILMAQEEKRARKLEAEKAILIAQEEKRAQEAMIARQKAAEIVLSKKSKSKDTRQASLYTVKKNGAVLVAARSLAVDPKDLIAQRNNSAAQKSLVVGQKLTDKHKPQLIVSNASSNAPQTIQHVVKKGDSLTGIARKFSVSVADIRKWNAAVMTTGLQSGQKIKVIVDAT
ncbi:MAG: transglycosylase SLT domain-containing protein [Methylococcaceae bacterium]